MCNRAARLQVVAEEEAQGEGRRVLQHVVREGAGCVAGEKVRKDALSGGLVDRTTHALQHVEHLCDHCRRAVV